MSYPCGIIKDLLPLYIDDVCNQESRRAVEEHLAECAACSECFETMKGTGSINVQNNHSEDIVMANSLKNIKTKINRRIAKIVFCVASAAMICIAGYHLLFNAAIRDVSFENVSISANVYSLEELIEKQEGQAFDSDSVTISVDENDNSELVAVRIPEIGDELVTMTENILKEYQSISIISVKSDYFLRSIQKERKDDAIYITAIKTTLLNNKTTVFQRNICGLEFGEINRIVFVDDNGAESVLWSR